MNMIERDRQFVWHPFTPIKSSPEPLPIASGKGASLFTTTGVELTDAISSWWVTIHGHAHPYIAEKLYQQALQLEQVIFAGFTHEPAVSLAERLLPLLPGDFAKIFYSDNGSTAVEVAMKMALQYHHNLGHQRRKILVFEQAYHGDTFGAMSVSERGVFTLAFHDYLFEVVCIDTPTTENIDRLLQTIEADADAFAFFIYEPVVQGVAGMRMYAPALLDRLLQACKSHHIICIADEVMTGFGRTGKMFAGHYLQQQADIMCVSKGLTGGTLPMGITAATDQVFQAFVSDDKTRTFFHGHSFTANPLACTAALASLDLFEMENSFEQINRIAAQHLAFINKISSQTHLPVKNLRSLGTILAMEIITGEKEGYLNDIAAIVTQKVLALGVYLRPLGNTLYVLPPYCISREALERVYAVIEHILQSL
jgi:adenosylmethionine---8-amino-7-oxononanoate aminotransferase